MNAGTIYIGLTLHITKDITPGTPHEYLPSGLVLGLAESMANKDEPFDLLLRGCMITTYHTSKTDNITKLELDLVARSFEKVNS